MLYEWLQSSYKKNHIIVFILVAVTIAQVINSLELDILNRIALTNDASPNNTQYQLGNDTCPHVSVIEDNPSGQDTVFYWTEQEKLVVGGVRFYSSNLVFFFGGILSDRFGGHRVALAGMALSAAPMTLLYLVVLGSSNLFVLMLFLRGIGYGLIRIAFMSLIGKLAPPSQRNVYVGTFAAFSILGDFLGRALSTLFLTWKIMCQFCGLVGTITAIWWWLVCRSHWFPRVHQLVKIPCKFLLTSWSFYVLIIFYASCSFHTVLRDYTISDYIKKAIFLKINGVGPKWVFDFVCSLTRMFTYIFCGATCDFIISKSYLPTMVARRCFIVYSIVILFCALVVVRLVECSRLAVLGCYIVFHYTVSITLTICCSVTIDFSPSCTGGLIGMFWMVFGFVYATVNALTKIYSPNDITSWSELYFTQFILVVVLSLPFVLCGVKRIPWPIEKSCLDWRRMRSAELERVNNQPNLIQDSYAGPSK